jgi:hypothetical protein
MTGVSGDVGFPVGSPCRLQQACVDAGLHRNNKDLCFLLVQYILFIIFIFVGTAKIKP